jgi:hypothetical protein
MASGRVWWQVGTVPVDARPGIDTWGDKLFRDGARPDRLPGASVDRIALRRLLRLQPLDRVEDRCQVAAPTRSAATRLRFAAWLGPEFRSGAKAPCARGHGFLDGETLRFRCRLFGLQMERWVHA